MGPESCIGHKKVKHRGYNSLQVVFRFHMKSGGFHGQKLGWPSLCLGQSQVTDRC